MSTDRELTDDPVLDDAILSNMAGGSGSDVVATLVEGFLEEARERVSAIEEAVARHDVAAVGFQAHALKSTAQTYGATRLGSVASILEEAAKVPECEIVRHRAGYIEGLMDETEKAFRARFLSG
jgi:HPt (histidine-containing phosphotransfer) domain-containing protein